MFDKLKEIYVSLSPAKAEFIATILLFFMLMFLGVASQ
jgi:hypothetical protein